MIKLDSMEIEKYLDNGGRVVKAKLIADTSLEVEANGKYGAGVEELNDNDEMSLGSTCITADAEIGILNSAGNWNFQ